MAPLPDFQLLRPGTASEAVRQHAAHPDSRYLAGGTDLLPNLRRGLVAARTLIDLSAVAELADISETDSGLRIGAGVSLAALATHALTQRRLCALAQAAGAVAGPTHRLAATLGGNLCLETRCRFFNQSEAWREANDFCMKLGSDTCRVAAKSPRCYAAFSGDVAPALLALQAEVELLGPSGARRLPLTAFYRDDGVAWLALAPDELLLAVVVPLGLGWRSAYEKVRVRASIDYPLAGVAVALRRERDVLTGVQVALTGVSSRPEAIDGLDTLLGRPLDEGAMALFARQVQAGIHAMGTTLVAVPYRRQVVPVLAKRLVERLWAEGGGA